MALAGGGAASITAPHTTHHPPIVRQRNSIDRAEKRAGNGARAFEKPTTGSVRGGASGCSENPRLRKRHHPPHQPPRARKGTGDALFSLFFRLRGKIEEGRVGEPIRLPPPITTPF